MHGLAWLGLAWHRWTPCVPESVNKRIRNSADRHVPRGWSVSTFNPEDLTGTLVSRFQQQVLRHGDAAAVVADSGTLTYRELDGQANGIARLIRDHTHERQIPIATFMQSGALQLATLLGVLKSGNIYVPLEPDFPEQRNAHAARHAGADLVLTDAEHARQAGHLALGQSLIVDDIDSAERFPSTTRPDDTAFIIYTSGSTGVPKGVYFDHRTVLHQIMKFTVALDLQPKDRLTCFYSASVIGAMRDIYGALLNGAALWPFNAKQDGISAMAQGMRTHRVTIYNSVATLFRHFLDGLDPKDSFPDVRLVRLGGEMIYRKDVEKMGSHFSSDCSFFTGFGLSETGTVAHFFVPRYQDLPDRIPAGRAAEGMEILLLDDDGRALRGAGVGEIAIRSHYLARGYWREPELTAERFIKDPEGGTAPVFKTGDIGRYNEGLLEVIGRKDFQVKVRGYKVDLATLEAALCHCTGVGACAAASFVDDLGNTNLAAFVAPSEHVPAVSALRRELGARLPAHMLPSRFVFVRTLPLTANGKLDRQALKVPALCVSQDHRPADMLEHLIAVTWKDVLGTDRAGSGDDFWDLGGNSLLAAGLMADLQERLAVNVPMSALWEAPTVPKLSALLHRTGHPHWPVVVRLKAGASKPPLFIAPGAGSDALALYHLARHMANDQPVCALQYRGGDGVQQPHRRVEEAAADYIAEIRSAQPEGPYFLAGTSFGGLIAYEIAKQLVDSGEQVAMLAIIDTRAPGFPRAREGLGIRQTAMIWWRRFLPQVNQDDYSVENVKKGLVELGLRYCSRLLKLIEGERLRHKWRYLCILDTNVRLRGGYRPGPYDQKVKLFRTQSRPPAQLFLDDSGMGWSRYVRGKIEVIDIPGIHGAHIRPPHVSALGEKLQACIDQVHRRA